MERKEFKERFKLGKEYIIVDLADSSFYIDDYRFSKDGKYVNLYWKGDYIGYCLLNKVRGVR